MTTLTVSSEIQLAMNANDLGYTKAGFAYSIKKDDEIYFRGSHDGPDICGTVLSVSHRSDGFEVPTVKFVLQFPGPGLQVSFSRGRSVAVYFKPVEIFEPTTTGDISE